MPYRIYVRTFDQRVLQDTRTVTNSPAAAEAAFRELMQRRDFWATRHAVVLSLDGRQLEYRRFDRIRPVDAGLDAWMHAGTLNDDRPRHLHGIDPDIPAHADPDAYLHVWLDDVLDAPLLRGEPIKLFHD
jgi:hypothetical protein